VRWQAPELFQENSAENTTASDIYALACVFYEIYSSRVPFYDLKIDYTVLLAVQQGKRPPCPGGCSTLMWDLIEESWSQNASNRPTASQLTCSLEEMAPPIPSWIPLIDWDVESIAHICSLLAKGH